MTSQKNKNLHSIFATRNLVLIPGVETRLDVAREFNLKVLKGAKEEANEIFVVCQKSEVVDEPTFDELYKFGTLAKISLIIDLPDGAKRLVLEGIEVAEISEQVAASPVLLANITKHEVLADLTDLKTEALYRKLVEKIKELQQVSAIILNEDDIFNSEFYMHNVNSVANQILHKPNDRMNYIKLFTLNEKMEFLMMFIKNEEMVKKIDAEIDQKLNQQMMEQQREYHLREKMRLIKEELGEGEIKDKYIEDITKTIQSEDIPKNIKVKIEAELKRYELTPSNSSDANVIRSYIDWVMSLPWGKFTPTEIDIPYAKKTLDKNHYGLDKPKDRILEYLAVKKLKGDFKGTILLLDGPPGVGKTSLAMSIADVLGREFVKISLGGVKDESEIRGHRRTYLGSNPGRIIQAIRKSGVQNPVFLLDEIDKMGYDYKGDPSAALLEVLDPEQNSHFSDHYIEEDYDLSDVIFIATSNEMSEIPSPLLDRMEVISLSGYTEKEKMQIAKKHIIPKVIKEVGFKTSQVSFSSPAINKIITEYTMEAGVRELERKINKVMRKVVIEYTMENFEKRKIEVDDVAKMLGVPRMSYFKKQKEDQVGVIMGLAYTSFGGDVLPIEVATYSGDGKVIITGQLGDVMQESAQIAFSYVKSQAAILGIDSEILKNNDVHIHAPEGAIPKDGPSAGVALTTVIASALTNRKIDHNYALTGEVTLRGNVLAIGGLKEKSAGALRAGITHIICPKANEKDLQDIPDEIKTKIKYTFVTHVDEVIDKLLK